MAQYVTGVCIKVVCHLSAQEIETWAPRVQLAKSPNQTGEFWIQQETLLQDIKWRTIEEDIWCQPWPPYAHTQNTSTCIWNAAHSSHAHMQKILSQLFSAISSIHLKFHNPINTNKIKQRPRLKKPQIHYHQWKLWREEQPVRASQGQSHLTY